MKTITPTLTPTTFFLPADDLRAAFQCISTEQTRYYLGGVLIEADTLVALTGGEGVGDPIKVEFKASTRLRGTLMPMWW